MAKKRKVTKSRKVKKSRKTPYEQIAGDVRLIRRSIKKYDNAVVAIYSQMERMEKMISDSHRTFNALDGSAKRFVSLCLGEKVSRVESMVSQLGMTNSRVMDGLEALAQEALKNRTQN